MEESLSNEFSQTFEFQALFSLCLDPKNNKLITQKIKSEKNFVYTTKDEYQQTLLHLTAQAGNFELAQILLDEGANVDAEDFRKNTPLFYTCRSSKPSLEIVKLLISKGAKVTHTNNIESTPLHLICSLKDHFELGVEIAKLLVANGADVNAQTKKAKPRLSEIETGHQSELHSNLFNSLFGMDESNKKHSKKQEELKKDKQLSAKLRALLPVTTDPSQCKGFTPLHIAVESNNVPMVRFLLENGANANLVDETNQQTPLFSACTSPNPEPLLALLIPNCSLNHLNSEGESVFHIASNQGNFELLNSLIKFIPSKNKKLYIDILNKKQQSPLLLASSAGKDSIVNLLLEHRADPTLYDSFGYQPLHEAVSFNHFSCVKLLIESGRLDIINSPTECFPQSTPLHIAASMGLDEIAKYLIQHGAFPLIKDAQDCTPDSVAINEEMKEYLNNFVQVKLVHERTLVIHQDDLDLKLCQHYEWLQKEFGNNVKLEMPTKGSTVITLEDEKSNISDLEFQILSHPKEEGFIVISSKVEPTSFGLLLKVRRKGEILFHRIELFSRTLNELVQAIQKKLNQPNPPKQIIELPDILIESDEDVSYLKNGISLECEF